MKGKAAISECGLYRINLFRDWNISLPTMRWIMLNPSTADATIDDPTIRKCIGFAKKWGYGGIIVHNLFSFRATSPKNMKKAQDPVGPDNDRQLFSPACENTFTVAAWGNHGDFEGRGRYVISRTPGLWCLGVTKKRCPKHPLYVPYSQERIELSECLK